MIISFCGHSQVNNGRDVQSWLRQTVDVLIDQGATTFYLGGYGEFDRMAAAVLLDVKKSCPHLVMTLILPYLNSSLDASGYDDTLYPPPEDVPPKFAISKRNQWMVDSSDAVVAYVIRSWGGAAQTLYYARRRKKKILLYPEQ